MAKADLIKDAEARGLVLTGKETVDDLKAMLEAAGESGEDVDKEAAIDDAVQEVAASKKAVEKAQAALDKAKADLDEAHAIHAALVKEPDAVPGKELYVEGSNGSLSKLPMPADWGGVYQYRLLRAGGVNYEHVSEGPGGVWVYRQM